MENNISFIKNGDAQPIIAIIKADEDLDEKTRIAQLQAEQDAKNINKDDQMAKETY